MLMEQEQTLTISKASNAVTISKVKREVGFKNLLKAVSFLVNSCVRTFNYNAGEKENIKDQVTIIASDIINKFPYESLEDFVLCFKKARTFEYGKVFRLESLTFFEWIEKYLNEKADYLEGQEHNINYPKGESNNTFVFEGLKEPEFEDPVKDLEAKTAFKELVKLGYNLRKKKGGKVTDFFKNAEVMSYEKTFTKVAMECINYSDEMLEICLKDAENKKYTDIVKVLNKEKERRTGNEK